MQGALWVPEIVVIGEHDVGVDGEVKGDEVCVVLEL